MRIFEVESHINLLKFEMKLAVKNNDKERFYIVRSEKNKLQAAIDKAKLEIEQKYENEPDLPF